MDTIADIERVVRDISVFGTSPGGAVAVIRNGDVILRHAWGFANLEMQIAFTPATAMPICSITKQFTCATLLSSVASPDVLDGPLRATLPALERQPTITQLCHNQSGIRDYWALTVLMGASVEGAFADMDAERIIAMQRGLNFKPGTQYSYCNTNFRILGDLLEGHSGRSLAELYARHIFEPVGMASARLSPDTAQLPGGICGYEGNALVGYRPAINRIYWTGDAGITASLDDMIAWDVYIDRNRDARDNIYVRLSGRQQFEDGRAAPYGFGLFHTNVAGTHLTGHGGALRGFRCHRWHSLEHRISVIVMWNHEGDARAAATRLIEAAIGGNAGPMSQTARPDDGWAGNYVDDESGLALCLTAAGCASSRIAFGPVAEMISSEGPDIACSQNTILTRDAHGLAMRRFDNIDAPLRKIEPYSDVTVEGEYYCAEIESHLSCLESGGVLYVRFSGFLGDGDLQPLTPIGQDAFILLCPRSMDAPAPGQWTLLVQRVGNAITGLRVGCWLARGLVYLRQAPPAPVLL